MTERDLNAIVVGSNGGASLHIPALRGAGLNVGAMVGRDPTKTAHRAALLGVPLSFTSLTEALTLSDVDVVVVATPPQSHGPLVREALAAGKHVVCEKPFAMDVPEAREMLAAAQQAESSTSWAPSSASTALRHFSTVRFADGAVGRPRLAVELLQVPTLADRHARVPQWFDDAEAGGGWFGGSAPHILDRVRSMLGEFTTVNASLQRLGPRPGVTADDTYTITFTLDSGVEGVIHSSAAVAGPSMVATKVTGTEGTAWIDFATRSVCVDDGRATRQIPVPEDLVNVPGVPPPPELLTTPYEMWHSTGNEVVPYIRLYRSIARPYPRRALRSRSCPPHVRRRALSADPDGRNPPFGDRGPESDGRLNGQPYLSARTVEARSAHGDRLESVEDGHRVGIERDLKFRRRASFVCG